MISIRFVSPIRPTTSPSPLSKSSTKSCDGEWGRNTSGDSESGVSTMHTAFPYQIVWGASFLVVSIQIIWHCLYCLCAQGISCGTFSVMILVSTSIFFTITLILSVMFLCVCFFVVTVITMKVSCLWSRKVQIATIVCLFLFLWCLCFPTVQFMCCKNTKRLV